MSKLEQYNLGGFKDGWNGYTGSKTNIKDTEIAAGQNTILDDNGSATKVSGASRFGGLVNNGYAVDSGIHFKTDAGVDKVLVHSGTSIFWKNGESWTATTGGTWLSTVPVWFCQALDRVYAIQENGAAMYYTTDGLVWNVAASGKTGKCLTFANGRLYLIADDKKVWFSNTYTTTVDITPSVSLGDFGRFDTALPSRNAGFIQQFPGGGVEPTALYLDQEVLTCFTREHGFWEITDPIVSESDGSVSHSVIQKNAYYTTVAPKAVMKVGNDLWFDGIEDLYTRGEVAQFVNIRFTPKSGRIRTEIQSKNQEYANLAALGFKDNRLYYAYAFGTFNDRVSVYDAILNAWGTPLSGFNCSFFMNYYDGNTRRLLYGSSDPSDSYMYEMGTGSSIGDDPINAYFESKSSDLGHPGLVKWVDRAEVYYSMVYGTLTYRAILDENREVTGTVTIGNSTSRPVGLGSLPLGSSPLGEDYVSGTTFAELRLNDSFTIDVGGEPCKRISVRIENSETGEQYKIDDIEFWFRKAKNPYVTIE